mgnify:CR=1 FL=1
MQTYTFGMYNHLETIQEESRTGFCNQNVVVAGDPAQQGHKKGKACALPDTLFIKKLMLSLTYREGVFKVFSCNWRNRYGANVPYSMDNEVAGKLLTFIHKMLLNK